MTDKPIIIDGVDVSGCRQYMLRYMEDYDIDTFDYCRHYFKLCKDVDVKYCYYKQLKAKEQECEELKKNVEHWKMDHKEAKAKGEWTYDLVKKRLEQQLDKLKAENEKYSFFIEKLCDYIGLECDSEEQAMRTLSDFARQMNKARLVIDRYKQTLTEIKEIAENSCCLQPTSDCEEHENCKECSRTSDDETVKQILQKISEVTENEI